MTPEDLLQDAQALNLRGEPYAMVTVVRTTPPTSAYVGAQAIVLADGSLRGSVGGGCAREVVVQAALAAMRNGAARLVLISNASQAGEPVEQHPMRCASDGEIEVFIHPHTPAPLLLVLGATPTALQARGFAAQCGFRVVDRADGPEAAQIAIALVATQGEGDEEALKAALDSPARDVLLVASRRKAEGLREAMRLRGVGPQRLAAIHAPAGPDIGAHTPAHIALAAVAGAVACWRQPQWPLPMEVPLQPQAQPPEVASASASASASAPPPVSQAYLNPVCGAPVVPAEALHVVAYGGDEFYFCCDGCKLEFERDPARYAAIQAGRRAVTAALVAA
jgi:xanthine dehydrogenase accessory factor